MTQRTRLGVLLALNLGMIIGLIVVGLSARSLGVLAAGGDYVADSAAIALGLIAISIRDRVGEDSRATTIVAAINAGVLLVVTAVVIVEAVRRLLNGAPEVHGLPVLIASAIATLVMVTGAFVLGRDAADEDLHMRSVLLDTVADALTSAAVAVTGAIIYATGRLFWLDSVVAIGIGAVIGAGALHLARDVVRALRSGTQLLLEED